MPTKDVAARVERICADDLHAKAMREELIAALRPAVPFDAYVFALTDPVTRIATSPLADVPGLPWPRLPDLIRWRYLTRLNRWDVLLDAGINASSLQDASGGRPEQSLLWHRAQREIGAVDTVMVPFGDRYGCWAALELWRMTRAFTPDEVEFLGTLHSAITAGLRAALARTFALRSEPTATPGSAVVVLGPDLQVQAQTDAAARTLLQLNPPSEPMAPIPAAAYNIGAALIAKEQRTPVGEPWSRVHLGGNQWVTLRASRLGADEIAVSIEPATPAERLDLFARAHGFSGREAEILGLLARGLDSREIAGELFLSEHTVHDHVKSALGKAGVRTRQLLLARAVGAGESRSAP